MLDKTSAAAPRSLYKYLPPERALQVVACLRIRFSQVSVLNDADEFQPQYKGVGGRDVLERGVRERFQLKHPKAYAEVYRKLRKEEADKLIDEMVSEWANTVEANYEMSVKNMYAELDRNFGVLSLSETLTSTLMWSFYGDGGRGLVIEFNSSEQWFNAKKNENDSFRHLRQMRYIDDRKPDYLLSTSDDDVLYTKTTEWEFEKEWRIIRNFNEAAEKVGVDNYGKDVLLFDIPPATVVSLILGYRATPQMEEILQKMIGDKANLSHLNLRRAVREANGHLEIV